LVAFVPRADIRVSKIEAALSGQPAGQKAKSGECSCETVFSRMAALGLTFVGPQAPHGRRAEPWPAELPRASNNVPTYYTKQQSPASCTRQLDFVFASDRLAERVRVRALNEPDQWGPSDHCRVEIQVA
jgi:hypothetical protein